MVRIVGSGAGSPAEAANYGTIVQHGTCSGAPVPDVSGYFMIYAASGLVSYHVTLNLAEEEYITGAEVVQVPGEECGVVTTITDLSYPNSVTLLGNYVLELAQVPDMFSSVPSVQHVVIVDTNVDSYWFVFEKVPPPQPTRVPTVSQWGLVGLTALLLTAGTVMLRRRRSAAA